MSGGAQRGCLYPLFSIFQLLLPAERFHACGIWFCRLHNRPSRDVIARTTMQNHIDNLARGLPSLVNSLAILIAAAICSGVVCAQSPRLRLGAPQVLSSLGSQLLVKIPIDAAESGDALPSARFSLGAMPPNAVLPFIERAEITLEKQGEQYTLVIRSRDAINEPAVGIVIREELPGGARSRELFLLLDPSSRATAQSTGQRPGEVESTSATPQSGPSAVRPANATAKPAMPSTPAVRKPAAQTKQAATSAPNARISRGDTVTLPRIKPNGLAFTLPAFSADSPRLRLSFGENLVLRQLATEAERAELRLRRFTLDFDDMTSAFFERQNRTMQLEKELTGLTARISAAERAIDIAAPYAAASSAAAVAAPGALPAMVAPAPAPAPVVVAPATAVVKFAPAQDQTESQWRWWLAGGLLAALVAVIWSLLALLRTRSQPKRLEVPTAEDHLTESFRHAPAGEAPTAALATRPDASPPEAPEIAAALARVEKQNVPLPEIQFELPELSSAMQEAIQNSTSSAVSALSPTLNSVDISIDDLAAQRLRGLLIEYDDIARLMPRLDSPRRLLEQAATLCDHGETDFAIRLLAFSAYSQPATPEYWLALLELLFLEKLSREYLVNAAMFYQFHAKSTHWDEVVRIGYLLNPREPLFAPAKTWSHEAPAIGTWLPFYPLKKPGETPATRR